MKRGLVIFISLFLLLNLNFIFAEACDDCDLGSISVGGNFACGIRANDSRVLCWGYGYYGRLGDGISAVHNNTIPTLTADTSEYLSVSAGDYHACGIRKSDGRVLCWGDGSYGALGDGNNITTVESLRSGSHAALIPPLTVDTSAYSDISVGWRHACGIRANDSRVLCWGFGRDGQLGNGLQISLGNPTLISDNSVYSKISAGVMYTCGIRANDSRVLCWGLGEYGQLGDGRAYLYFNSNPTLTTDTSGYKEIEVGYYHTCGIRANDSRVLCWGRGIHGELGDGISHNIGSPVLTTDTSAYSSGNCDSVCVEPPAPSTCTPDCSCAFNACISTTCSNGCNGSCDGLKICPVCGNGIIESPEKCDDGNLINLDGCSDSCTKEGFLKRMKGKLNGLFSLK